MRGKAYSQIQTFGNQFQTYLSSRNYFIKMQKGRVPKEGGIFQYGVGGLKVTKIQLLQKQCHSNCHDSLRYMMIFCLAFIKPTLLLLPYIDIYVDGSLLKCVLYVQLI